MLIFWEKRLVFLATPKAGSTAVEVALESLADVAIQRPASLKHADLRTFRQHIEPWLQSAAQGASFTTIALMREPIEWLRSWYRFRLRDDFEAPEHTMTGMNFADFAAAYADPMQPSPINIRSQADFLTCGDDQVDHIFRYENMDAFTTFLEDRLDCAISLPRVNVPPAVDVSLTARQEQTVRQIMARDMQLYSELPSCSYPDT